MQKMLKIASLLLIIATIVFAAGCAEQSKEDVAEEGSPVEETAAAGEMPNYIVGTEAQFPPL